MRAVVDGKYDDIGQAAVRHSRHPLPWRNEPSGGENHVADANGRPVYDGSDAAEMFRLYSDEAQAAGAERPADGRHRAPDSRTRHRWARRTT